MSCCRRSVRIRVDRLGLVLSFLILLGLALPFVVFRPTRIASGRGLAIWQALPFGWSVATLASLGLGASASLFRAAPRTRLAVAVIVLVTLVLALGAAARSLAAEASPFARISAASGFWCLLLANALAAVDALSRLATDWRRRLVSLAAATAAMAAILASGALDDLAVLREYRAQADVFWTEVVRHLALAFGSSAIAVAAGVPLGMLCRLCAAFGRIVLAVLNAMQTIPSIALFALLIAPLMWLARAFPALGEAGFSGVGAAPAFIALVLYGLLPVVANTVAGFAAVPPAVIEAAAGMGMTLRQRLMSVEWPLALPVILSGVRICLVQAIGLATVAALIGGGGLGTFVFQGAGQTAVDLILLGAVPTVALALGASIVLDALIEAARRHHRAAP